MYNRSAAPPKTVTTTTTSGWRGDRTTPTMPLIKPGASTDCTRTRGPVLSRASCSLLYAQWGPRQRREDAKVEFRFVFCAKKSAVVVPSMNSDLLLCDGYKGNFCFLTHSVCAQYTFGKATAVSTTSALFSTPTKRTRARVQWAQLAILRVCLARANTI